MLVTEDILTDVSNNRYNLKLAKTQEEFESALRLRFNIFNHELRREFEFKNGKDYDEYDEQFHHLIVEETETEKIIGTYRLQAVEQAGQGNGFLTNKRFKLEQFPEEILQQGVEVGRACIAEEHRSGRVLYLLWKGLAKYLTHFNKRYLFGYSAISSYNASIAWQTRAFLEKEKYIHPEYRIEVQENFRCKKTEPVPGQKPGIDIPPLFQNYLDVGCTVCGGPSQDREKELIHFLIFLDVEMISDQTRKMFFG